ncbi:unnamed protein product (macronuclear) [Paramecium tetraurelia]|uniref:Peptidase A1 domain-containing protein n=1 Tax=Paramecium tetraurelia TaxID=5888 RepID=A0BNR1_PARTE|nr:uncharacterized protein GSPATT00030817001 [Paramecium tetraurelia]CAK60178.1 unnamed protein product [Paramecium tetraurelia]|eukprot:XP_001427576.1 hypothetical protein (macronuclear) [Paramecium tetraurelia strain d4-2]
MFLIIFVFVCQVIGEELLNLSTKTFFIESEVKGVKEVIQGSRQFITDFENAEFAINIELQGNNSQPWDICFSQQGSIEFADYENHHTLIYNATHNPDEEHANDPSYYLSTPILVNMVKTNQGLMIATSDHTLLNYNITQDPQSIVGFKTQLLQEYDYDYLRSEATEAEVPQIVYAPIFEYVFLIYRDQILKGKIQPNMTLQNCSIGSGLENDNNFIGQIKILNNYMFVPLGRDGLDIYQINKDGDISLKLSMNSFDFYNKDLTISLVDVVFSQSSTSSDTYAFILDSIHGVTKFLVKTNEQQITMDRDEKFGLVNVRSGLAIAVQPDDFLLILKEVGINQQLVEIGFKDEGWFEVKTHFLTGQYFDITISKQFVLLRGKSEHRIVRTGVYEEFEPEFKFYTQDDYFTEKANSFYEDYVFVPKLQNVQFYDSDFVTEGTPNSWSFQKSYPYLLGLTQHYIVELPYIIRNPQIYCNPRSELDVGNIYKYDILMNATSCPEKDKYLEENPTVPYQTIQCSYKNTFQVKVVLAQAKIYNTQELIAVIIGLIILLILLAFLLAYLYRKYKVKEEGLTSQVSGFDNQKGYDLEPNDAPATQGL